MPHILLVEDHRVVAEAIKETLELEGWNVTLCGVGAAAVRWLASKANYDLMMLDNHLPNLDGLEVVRYACGLEHRKGMPIIMFSASECSRDAILAGVNEYLRKPRDIGKIVETVARLLATSSTHRDVPTRSSI
ncbi:MAG TPA: response regulator [Pyrinomonadaceae bacterium]|jgi:DNA-binding response OmpR family regulator